MPDCLRPVWVITCREVRDQLRDWRIIFPVLGLTLFFPFLMNFTARSLLDFVARYGATLIGERLVPFLLMIVGFFPISVSLVIALESFVGEKERGSIEPLLNTPLRDWQLYLGKFLSSTILPLFSSYLGMTVYLVGLRYEGIPWPEPSLLFLIFVLTSVQAVMMVSGAVVVSSQATSVRSANLLASFIIIPAALLVQGESIVMFWGNLETLWWVVFGLVVLTALLVRVGLAHFQREELLGHEIDVLNVRWMARVFLDSFRGGARTLAEWYFRVLPGSIKDMRHTILIVTGLTVAGIFIGVQQVEKFYVSIDPDAIKNIDQRLEALLNIWPLFSVQPVLMIFWHNVRVLLLSMVIGSISLGILGTLPLLATMVVVGYLYGLLISNGFPALTYLGLVLPHGVIEIPAAILATASMLRAGALLATPQPGKTVGEVWLAALAHWVKIMVGVVIPLLLIAAMVEAWVTPRIALGFFG